MADSIFQLKWYCSTGVCPRGAQVRQRCGRSLNPLSSMKTMVRPSLWAFFSSPANASASTAASFLRPVPAPAPLDAGSSSPTAAECARLARHGSGPRIPLRSGGPRATRSTNWCRSPELVAHASARARCAADLPDANAVCAQPVPLSSGRAVRPAGVAAPSGSLTADALPPGWPLPPEELPAATAEPRVSVAAPVPENLAELLLGFPWTDHSRRRPECHYIIQCLIVNSGGRDCFCCRKADRH